MASETTGPSPGFTCARCGLPNPRLEEPPFETDLGRRIHASICQPCWLDWMGYSIKVINEYRLNLATEQGEKIYDEVMQEFLGLGSPGKP